MKMSLEGVCEKHIWISNDEVLDSPKKLFLGT